MSMPIGPVKVTAVKDAEVRELTALTAGSTIATVTVAYNERVKNPQTGEWGPLMWEDAKDRYDSVGEYLELRVFRDQPLYDLVAAIGKGDFLEITGKRFLRGYLRNKDGSRGIAVQVNPTTITVVNPGNGSGNTVTREPALTAPPF